MPLLAVLALSLAAAARGDGLPAPALDARPAPAARAAPAPGERARRWSLEQVLDAVRFVETGGEKDGGRQSTGDSGGAIGPFQIHRAYWVDARVPGRWEDCRDPGYARSVVLAYWRRYCPKALEALDAETLARIHNGGPDGAKEDATLKFWRKVERALVQQAEARDRERAAREASAKRGEGRPMPASGPKGGAKAESQPAPKPPEKPAGRV